MASVNRIEMTMNVVSNHAHSTAMSTDDLLNEIERVYAAIGQLEEREGGPGAAPKAQERPALTAIAGQLQQSGPGRAQAAKPEMAPAAPQLKKGEMSQEVAASLGADFVSCLLCGKSNMKSLSRHLTQHHQMKPKAYRKQFGIPASHPLTATNFSEMRRKMSLERGDIQSLVRAKQQRGKGGAAATVRRAKTERPVKAAAPVREKGPAKGSAKVKPVQAPAPTAAPGSVAESAQHLAKRVAESFQEDSVTCLLCGKGDMKTLSRHLTHFHNITPKEYRKQFGIARSQPLTAKSFSEFRSNLATSRGDMDSLSRARDARTSKVVRRAKQEKVRPAKAAKSESAAPKQQKSKKQ